MDKKSMLKAIVSHYTEGNKARFANLLGVSAQTISAWGARNTFDSELIYTKCSDISADWLLTGRGSMLRSDQEQPIPQPVIQSTPPGDDSFIYKMYEKEKEGKEALIKENGRLEERVRALEEKISTCQGKEPDSPTAASLITEAFTSEPFGDSVKDSIHTRNPTMSLKKLSGVKT